MKNKEKSLEEAILDLYLNLKIRKDEEVRNIFFYKSTILKVKKKN